MNPISALLRVPLGLILASLPCVAQAPHPACGPPAGPRQALLPGHLDPSTPGEPLGFEDTRPLVLEGQVFMPDRRPATGAVVVSSAGGLAEVRADGTFRLELEVPAAIDALQLTAVANGPQGSLTAQRQVQGLVLGASNPTGPMHLTTGSGCEPDWIPTFGGHPGVDGSIHALATFDDGSGLALYVGGEFTSAGGVAAKRVARWDGQAWSSLGVGVGDGSFSPVYALAVFDDGSGPALYAGGAFTSAGGQPANHTARWDGQAWSSLGVGVGDGSFSPVYALAVFDDGSGPALYAGGAFTSAGGQPANHIARWDGQAWSSLGVGVNGEVSALAAFDDGSGPALYAGGGFTSAGGQAANHIARWDGQAWSPLGVGVNGWVSALAAFDDAAGPALYAGGWFTSAGDQPASRVARWDGQAWSPLGNGVSQSPGNFGLSVSALAVFDDGSGPALYVGGYFDAAGGQRANNVARWDGIAWSPLGEGVTQEDWWGHLSPDPRVSVLGAFSDGHGSALYVGGSFALAGGMGVNRIARWNGATWGSLGVGLNHQVNALTVFDDGDGPALYVGGHFTSAGGKKANGIARWDGQAWSPLGEGVNHWVYALAVFDDGSGPALYVGGLFTSAGGQPASGVARWDGQAWSALGSGVQGQALALAVFDDGSGSALYVGGVFFWAGGQQARSIARWDGQTWSPLGNGMSSPGGAPSVWALCVFDDGSGPGLYAGGWFNSPGSHIARWDGLAWSPLGSGADDGVLALADFDDGTGPALYAGGRFNSAGGQAASGIARWDGHAWSALGSGVSGGSNPRVAALRVFDDGTGPALYAGGMFSSAGGVATNSIARWNGQAWSPLAEGIRLWVAALTGFDDGSGPALYAGGYFTGSPAGDSHLAKWDGCLPPMSVSFCFGDGSGMACPCGNTGGAGEGCANSTGGGARLAANGSNSISAGDLVLHGSGLLPGQFGLYFQGLSTVGGGNGLTFGDGLRCVGAPTRRLEVHQAQGNGTSQTTVDLAAMGGATLGIPHYYQLWYRDSSGSPCGGGFNLTNALELVWQP